MKFSIITYNIHKGKGIPCIPSKPSLHDLANGLAKQNADLILCQEVAEVKSQQLSQCCEIAKQLQFNHHYGANSYFPNVTHGNATFSRFPSNFNCNLNMTTQHLKHRGILYSDIELTPHQHLHVFNVHLSTTAPQKQKQIDLLIKYINILTKPHDPVIVGGVFNDYLGRLKDSLKQNGNLQSALQPLSKSEQKTWPSIKPSLRTDQIFYRHLQLLSTQVLKQAPWKTLSDHLPVYSEFITLHDEQSSTKESKQKTDIPQH